MAVFINAKNFIFNFFREFLFTEKGDFNFLGKIIYGLIIYLIMRLAIKLTRAFINKSIKKRVKYLSEKEGKKYNTIAQVIKSLVKIIIYFIGMMTILDIFDINTNSLIATAGIGSLAIGFGAQSLVKDVITGSFILLENQYSVGDHVEIKGYEGIIEDLGLRLTKIRDFNGSLHIIPNGEISIVTNKSRGSIKTIISFTISYKENIDKVIKVLENSFIGIKARNEDFLEDPVILGVNKLGLNGFDISIKIVSNPLTQYQNERSIKKIIKEVLEKEGIELTYSKLIVFNKED